MMIEPSDASDDQDARTANARSQSQDTGPPDADAEEEKVLRTRIPARHRLELNRRKVLTGDLIKDIVREALAEYLELSGQDDAAGGKRNDADGAR